MAAGPRASRARRPSADRGALNFPLSRRFPQMRKPSPSHCRIYTMVPRRLKEGEEAAILQGIPLHQGAHGVSRPVAGKPEADRCRAVEHPGVGGKHQHGGIPGRRPITRQGVPSSKPRDRRTTTPRASRETPLSSPPARDGAEGGGGTSRSSNGEDGAERRRRQRRSIRMLAPDASQCSPSVNPQRPHSARRPRHKANVDSLCMK